MKAKLIYREGQSYFGGINPWNEKWTSVIEVEGKYYKIVSWGNYTTSGKMISEMEFDPENMPEEYARTENETNYSLTHGNEQEIEIALTEFDKNFRGDNIPEALREKYQEEARDLVRRKIAETIKANPNLDYHAILEGAELTEEQKRSAQAIIHQIETELTDDRALGLGDYTPIIENIVSLAKGESVIVTHSDSYYSVPDDFLISTSDINEGHSGRFVRSGETISVNSNNSFTVRRTRPDVFSLQGKKVKVPGQEMEYLGSWQKEEYSIDLLIDSDGNPNIMRNIQVPWYNNQHFEPTLGEYLNLPRFEIGTGEEGIFKDQNEKVVEVKKQRKEFYTATMQQAQEEFGISYEQARKLLEFAGSVRALATAVEYSRHDVTQEQLASMVRKISHEGFDKVIEENFNKDELQPQVKFDIKMAAAQTLQYIDYLQENSQSKETRVANVMQRLAEKRRMLEEAKAREAKLQEESRFLPKYRDAAINEHDD